MDVYISYADYITRIEDGATIPLDEANSDYQTYLAWVANGNQPSVSPARSFDEFVAHVSSMAGAWMDGWVHAQFNYDTIVSCVSYEGDANATYAAQATAAKAWRSDVYTRLYDNAPSYAAMPPGQWPDDAAIIAGLPQPGSYVWTAPVAAPTA